MTYLLYTDFIDWSDDNKTVIVSFVGSGMLLLLMVIWQSINLIERKKAIEVSDNKIFCTKHNGEAISLPINKNTEVKSGAFGIVFITTPKYRYHMLNLKNGKEIVDAVKVAKKANAAKAASKKTEVKKLIELKELLDAGVISSEEFEMRKKNFFDENENK